MSHLLVKFFWCSLALILIVTLLGLGFFGLPAAPVKIQKEIIPGERR